MERNYGIDLLRIVSAFLVICIHMMLSCINVDGAASILGGFLNQILYTICICAVNMFAIISGYVSNPERWGGIRLKTVINLWAQVVLYRGLFMIVFALTGLQTVSVKAILDCVFPISRNVNWYITGYVVTVLISPALLRFVSSIQVADLKRALFDIVLLCSVWTFFSSFIDGDPMMVNNGYSWVWLASCFCIGAILRKGKYIIQGKKCLLVMIVSLAVMVLWRCMFFFVITPRFGIKQGVGIWNKYTSPLVLAFSMAAVLFFSRLHLSARTIAFCKKVAPTCLGVFLIHTIVMNQLLRPNLAWIKQISESFQACCLIVSSVFIFAACSIIEQSRISVFHAAGIDKLLYKVSEMGEQLIEKVLGVRK